MKPKSGKTEGVLSTKAPKEKKSRISGLTAKHFIENLKARSKNIWERRTAIVATSYFLMKKQVEDTFNIAELLMKDRHDLIHKAAGGWIRQAGKTDRKRLLEFLDKYAETMPRTFLRYAIEHLDQKQKSFYMSLKDSALNRKRIKTK